MQWCRNRPPPRILSRSVNPIPTGGPILSTICCLHPQLFSPSGITVMGLIDMLTMGGGHCPHPLPSYGPNWPLHECISNNYIFVFFISANNSKRCYHSYDKKCHTDYDVTYEVRYEKGPSINDVVSIGQFFCSVTCFLFSVTYGSFICWFHTS